MALWAFVESLSAKKDNQAATDLLRQGLFLADCVLVSIAIDYYFLPKIFESFSPEFIPYEIYQFILLPVVLYLAAKIIGPTSSIQIGKAPIVKRFRKKQ